MKSCPYCAELIQDQAAKCRYCGEWLDPNKRPAWSGEAPRAAAPTPTATRPIDDTAATLPVGSGSTDLRKDAGDDVSQPARSWSAPAWLANAQAQKPEPTPAAPATTDPSTLEEVALRMERIRQSAAEVRQDAVLEATPPPTTARAQRATLEVEPGVTLPAGSLRSVGVTHSETLRAEPTIAPQPAPVMHHDEDEDDELEQPPARTARRSRKSKRRRAAAEAEPVADPRRARHEVAPEPALLADDEAEDLEPKPRRSAARDAAPPPAPFFEDDDVDEFDEFDEPEPRRAGGGFEEGFLDDDDEDDYDDDEDYGDDDFGAPAPSPLPWKPIALVAGVLAVVALFVFRDSIFSSDDSDEQVAEAADSEGTPEGSDGDEPPTEPEPEPKAEGEGMPVEPEGGSGSGGEAGAEAGAPPPATPAAPLDADTLAKLDDARKAYMNAERNTKKLEQAGALLQEILAKSPDHPEALTLMAQVYLEQDKVDESLASATRCTVVAAEHADCWLTIGVIQEQYYKKYPEAQVALQKYVDLSPDGRYVKDAKAALNKINRKLANE